MRKWIADHGNVLSVLVAACVGVVLFVIVVGGIVAISNPDTYPFRDYLGDLAAMGKFLIAAAIAVAAKVIAPLVTIQSGMSAPDGSTSKTSPTPAAPTATPPA